MQLEGSWRAEAEHSLGCSVAGLTRLHGGDFAESFRASLDDGRTVFIKTHSNPPDGFFSTEAAGLAWLGSSGSVRVPKVLAVSDNPALLVLEWIEQGKPTATTDEEFGRGLAELHRKDFATFGRPDARTTGSQAMDNTPGDTWNEFYAERRLLPLSEKAAAVGALSPKICGRIERLASRLDEFSGPSEPPSCLHGDLWAGNRVIDSEGHSWLIDPATFGGHREFDLALMALFGGFSKASFDSYEESFPLAAGWRHRVPLYQLATLIVHAIKFGGGYKASVEAAIQRYV